MCCDYRVDIIQTVLTYDENLLGYPLRVKLTPIPASCSGDGVELIEIGVFINNNVFVRLALLEKVTTVQQAVIDYNTLMALNFPVGVEDFNLDIRLRVICQDGSRKNANPQDVTIKKASPSALRCDASQYRIGDCLVDRSVPDTNTVIPFFRGGNLGKEKNMVLRTRIVEKPGIPAEFLEVKSFPIPSNETYVLLRTKFQILDHFNFCCDERILLEHTLIYECDCITREIELGRTPVFDMDLCPDPATLEVQIEDINWSINPNTNNMDVNVVFKSRWPGITTPPHYTLSYLLRPENVLDTPTIDTKPVTSDFITHTLQKSFFFHEGLFSFTAYYVCYKNGAFESREIKKHFFEITKPQPQPCCQLEFINYRVVQIENHPTTIWVALRPPIVEGFRTFCDVEQLSLLRFYLDYIPRTSNPSLTTVQADFNPSFFDGVNLYFKVQINQPISQIRNLRVHCRNINDLNNLDAESLVVSADAADINRIDINSAILARCRGNIHPQTGWNVGLIKDDVYAAFTFYLYSGNTQLFRKIKVYLNDVFVKEEPIPEGASLYTVLLHKSYYPCETIPAVKFVYSYVCQSNIGILDEENMENLTSVEQPIILHAPPFPC